MKLFIALIFILSIVECKLRKDWIKYKKTHNLKFETDEEDTRRYKIFKQNKIFVKEHNSIDENHRVEINKFAHLTQEEFHKYYLTSELTHNHEADNSLDREVDSVNIDVDWRRKGVVGPVRDQGQCGSCWAFSITAAIESAVSMKSNKSYILSPQQLVDCSPKNKGCHGGLESFTYSYLRDHLLEQEKDYPYEAKDLKCRYNKDKAVVKVKSYKVVRQNEKELTRSIILRPTSVRLYASLSSFQFYRGGVYYDKYCYPSETNHLVLAVGVLKNATHNYYIIKNSWGVGWGMQGYLLLARGKKPNCGVATLPTYPILE